MEKKFLSFNKIQLDSDNVTKSPDGKRTYIKGYACHFNTVNLNGEMVTPESFDKFGEILANSEKMPVLNYGHTMQVIGQWDHIYCDEKGLVAEGHLVNDIAFVRDNILPMIEDGMIYSLSTEGYVMFDDIEWFDDHYVAKNFELTAIALVELPADMDATVMVNGIDLRRGLKNRITDIDDPDSERKKKKQSVQPLFDNFLIY